MGSLQPGYPHTIRHLRAGRRLQQSRQRKPGRFGLWAPDLRARSATHAIWVAALFLTDHHPKKGGARSAALFFAAGLTALGAPFFGWQLSPKGVHYAPCIDGILSEHPL